VCVCVFRRGPHAQAICFKQKQSDTNKNLEKGVDRRGTKRTLCLKARIWKPIPHRRAARTSCTKNLRARGPLEPDCKMLSFVPHL